MSRQVTEPRRPILAVSPSRSGQVGSPTRQASKRSPCSTAQASSLTVPLTASDSSSPVISRLTAPSVGPPSADEPGHGGDEGGHAALHVGGAAAVEPAVLDLAGERVVPPCLAGAGRHHVDMAGERQMPPALPQLGEQVVDRVGAAALEAQAAAGEAQRLQRAPAAGRAPARHRA